MEFHKGRKFLHKPLSPALGAVNSCHSHRAFRPCTAALLFLRWISHFGQNWEMSFVGRAPHLLSCSHFPAAPQGGSSHALPLFSASIPSMGPPQSLRPRAHPEWLTACCASTALHQISYKWDLNIGDGGPLYFQITRCLGHPSTSQSLNYSRPAGEPGNGSKLNQPSPLLGIASQFSCRPLATMSSRGFDTWTLSSIFFSSCSPPPSSYEVPLIFSPVKCIVSSCPTWLRIVLADVCHPGVSSGQHPFSPLAMIN